MHAYARRERKRERERERQRKKSIKHERIKIKDVRRVFSNSGSWHKLKSRFHFIIILALVLLFLLYIYCFFFLSSSSPHFLSLFISWVARFSVFFSASFSACLSLPSFQFFWCIRSSRAGIHALDDRGIRFIHFI